MPEVRLDGKEDPAWFDGKRERLYYIIYTIGVLYVWELMGIMTGDVSVHHQ
jgi:hypothetical protein